MTITSTKYIKLRDPSRQLVRCNEQEVTLEQLPDKKMLSGKLLFGRTRDQPYT